MPNVTMRVGSSSIKSLPAAIAILKLLVRGDHVVRWHHRHRPVWIDPLDQGRSQADAGRCVALAGLADNVRRRQLRQLLTHRSRQHLIGQHQLTLRRHQRSQPIHGRLQHRSFARQGEQLLGDHRAAGGPKSSAAAACHNHCVKHVVYVQLDGVIGSL